MIMLTIHKKYGVAFESLRFEKLSPYLSRDFSKRLTDAYGKQSLFQAFRSEDRAVPCEPPEFSFLRTISNGREVSLMEAKFNFQPTAKKGEAAEWDFCLEIYQKEFVDCLPALFTYISGPEKFSSKEKKAIIDLTTKASTAFNSAPYLSAISTYHIQTGFEVNSYASASFFWATNNGGDVLKNRVSSFEKYLKKIPPKGIQNPPRVKTISFAHFLSSASPFFLPPGKSFEPDICLFINPEIDA